MIQLLAAARALPYSRRANLATDEFRPEAMAFEADAETSGSARWFLPTFGRMEKQWIALKRG
jgi:hypothetical protein